MNTILIIDDDDAIRRTMELHLTDKHYEVMSAENLATGRELWKTRDPEIVILDLKLPDGDGTTLLAERMKEQADTIVIMVTGHHDMEYAIRAMKSGAFNYIHKPLDIDEFDLALEKAVKELHARKRAKSLRLEAGDEFRAGRIAGQSRAILEIHKQIGLASKSPVNVLIVGASGTGKELVARAIHHNSAPDEPFVAVNCSAIVPTLMESEIFGHERGAFTGAHQRKIGKLEIAGAGTLFLDEIGDMPFDLQSKLLRVLQERVFERVGGTTSLPFQARVIAATHRNLSEMVQAHEFREDLYFRLKVIEISIPPLSERKEDIPVLVQHLLEKINRELHRKVTRIPDEVIQRLKSYHWPGNVRELENVLTQSVVRSTGDTLTLDFFGEPITSLSAMRAMKTLDEIEKEHIEWVLGEVSGNLGKACEVLGITRPTLRKKIEDFAIELKRQ
jgi:two-component system response regulator AtoC